MRRRLASMAAAAGSTSFRRWSTSPTNGELTPGLAFLGRRWQRRPRPRTRGQYSQYGLAAADPASCSPASSGGGGAGLRPAGAAAGQGRESGLLDLAGLETARADVCPLGRAPEHDADALEVGVEAPARRHHRVAPVVAE